MKKLVMVFLVTAMAISGVAGVTQASTGGQLYVGWANLAQFSWKFDNVAQGPSWSGTALGTWTVGSNTRDLGHVWCVDMFNYDYGNPEHYDQFTQADAGDENNPTSSLYAWTHPAGDGDDLRPVVGLGRAAWLANTFGAQADSHDVTWQRSLQMAIWTATYNGRFQWVSGGGIDETTFNGFMTALGSNSATQYEWYDNNQDGVGFQDFINDVPEPSSVALVGGTILSAALLAWKRKRGQ